MHVINYDLPSSDHGGIQEYIHRIGRTARIGQTGIASSFYSDRNEDLGPALTKILLESGQPVPDFLEQYKPEGPVDQIDFEDDSDEEVEASGDTVGEGDAWGAGGDAADPASGDAWGASPAGGDAWGAVHAPQAEAGW
jgi:ATP-dependent RNA helicase DDX3X